MQRTSKKLQRGWLIFLITLCVGAVLALAVNYLLTLRGNLTDQAVQNVRIVTHQQQQAFDNFIAGDRERLHSSAEYFSNCDPEKPEEIQRQLTIFQDVDAIYSMICFEKGWFCSDASATIRWLDRQTLNVYRNLTGSGVRESYTGLVSGKPKFGYYEMFTFANGDTGLIQKSYDRAKISETFSLSFYNDQGFAYLVNQEGDILLRSVGMIGERLYDNIFDVPSGVHGKPQDVGKFKEALADNQTGSITYTGDLGTFIYTYVPIETVEGWYLVSIVPESAITAETDRILINSRMALLLMAFVLAICGVFLVLVWRTDREIRKKDREIEYQEQLFEIFSTYLSDNSNDVYIMLDADTASADYASPNMERVLGFRPEDVLQALGQEENLSLSTGEPIARHSLWNLRPGEAVDGIKAERINPRTKERRWYQESVYCKLVQGRRKLVVYISDRTQERAAQNALTETLQMAQVASRAKSAFLSSVSHDIRTPMNAIIGLIGLLRQEPDNPELVREYTQRIDAASQHLLGLINDVLDMNKIESGSTTLNIANVSLAEIIDEINTIIRPQAKAREQTFDITASSLRHEHLQADKLRINQILINLLSNAVKYTQRGGRVELRVEELPDTIEGCVRVRFTVSDNGMGMSEEYQKVIFDPFTREETALTHEIQGTGLGMAITKSLVDLMGGAIKVDSSPGRGSVFTVELALRVQEREDDPGFWRDHGVGRMIVVDDEDEVCRNVVQAMESAGVRADSSTDARTAIRMVSRAREAGRPYDLILLDWKMPGVNGLEAARLIRKNNPDQVPILLLTAYDWEEIEQEAAEIGVTRFVPKPFFMSTFKEAVRRIMGGMKKEDGEQDSLLLGQRVLVVDDIEVNRIILLKILAGLGAVCDAASNGQEALDDFLAAEPGTYDLILMDVQMPVMDGYEATRAIRASGHPSARDIPIIAMTANAFVDDVRNALSSGMDAHVSKPVQLDKLKAAIRQVLDGRAKTTKGSTMQ